MSYFEIAPSILAANFLNLAKDIQIINDTKSIIHLDIMDGSFVPNISFGFPVIEQISKIATSVMDAHLMVVHPERWFEKLASYGVKMCSFHLEAVGSRNAAKYLAQIRSLGMQAGLVINPDIPVQKLFPYINKADYFLIMSVFAGFGGQKFIYESLDRITTLRSELIKRSSTALIEVDGGVDLNNIAALKEAGVNIAVAGSTVFKASDPSNMILQLRNK